MKLDLKSQHENFVKMSFEEKRDIVASMLDEVREWNELFENLYSLIISDFAIEQDFYDVFDSLIIVLYREEKEEEKLALQNLNEIKNRLENVREKEENEKLQWQKEAEELILNIL